MRIYRKIDNLKKFKEDIHDWRKKHGFTLKRLSEKLGHKPGYLSNLLSGNQYPGVEFWPKLKKVTGLKRSDYDE